MKRREQELRLLILGLDNAGKSTILKRILGEDVEKVEPTMGFVIRSMCWNGYKIHIWDIGGQKSIREFWKNHYEEADGIIWVIDVVDSDRFEESRNVIVQHENLFRVPLLVFLNKVDLSSDTDLPKAISELKVQEIIKSNSLFQPCSAIKEWNIQRGFEWLVNQVISSK